MRSTVISRKPIAPAPRYALVLSALLCLTSIPSRAQEKPAEIAEKSLEDLMNIEVTSASKKEQKLSRTTAAIYVITQEDIRRSGATSIPDLLRMVPGLYVAQMDSNTWAISARGFNDQFANKMLVLVDGRNLYTPLFSGVYWDIQDTLLEDIDHIEVIRGPGATVWGANAVNGVINIITKKAQETQGEYLSSGGGNQELGFAAAQHGAKFGSDGSYRLFAKFFDRNRTAEPFGQSAADPWYELRGGFRTDLNLSQRDSLLVEADAYRSRYGLAEFDVASLSPLRAGVSGNPAAAFGGDVMARWTRVFSTRSQMSFQADFDRSNRDEKGFSQTRNTVDLDFQHHLAWGARQDLVWGLGYQFTADTTQGEFDLSFAPPSLATSLFSSFVQDEIAVVPDRLWLVVGSKFEHNDYTGFEYQPSTRLLWKLRERHAVWAAVSRAVRTASRADNSLRRVTAAFIDATGTISLATVLGDPATVSEELLAYEFGYRAQAAKRVSLDLAAFYNRYDDLRSIQTEAPFLESFPPPPHRILPRVFQNQLRGETHGLELASSWQATGFWNLSGAYSLLEMHLHRNPTSTDTTTVGVTQGNSPRHQFNLRSRFDLPRRVELDAATYHVGRLATGPIPSYTRVDARLGWRATESLEVSAVGENLLQPRHPEFSGINDRAAASQVRRSVYGKLAWHF